MRPRGRRDDEHRAGRHFQFDMMNTARTRHHSADFDVHESFIDSPLPAPHICFFGLENLSVLTREHGKRGVGGEQVQQTLLARAATQRGYRVSMVVADYGQPDGHSWDGIQVFKTLDPSANVAGVRFAQRCMRMWDACKRASADIYYTSCAGFHVGLLAMYAQRYRARLVFRTAHDNDCEPLHVDVPHWHDKALYAYGLRRAHNILTQTEKQQETLLRNYGLHSVVTPMLVEQPLENKPLEARDISVLWVNNLRNFKRPLMFLDLATRLAALRFDMIGGRIEGSDRLYDEVSARARIHSHVRFHGQIPYHDVNDYYSRARVFVNTSETEGFPNSYLQAWARGTPVVTFFDPDRVIERENLGVVVSSMDEMVAAVQRLAVDDSLWRDTSERCRRYMIRAYPEKTNVQPYMDVFDKQVNDVKRLRRCTAQA